jgi:hypothetical protein
MAATAAIGGSPFTSGIRRHTPLGIPSFPDREQTAT